jgi:hypothetical protein
VGQHAAAPVAVEDTVALVYDALDPNVRQLEPRCRLVAAIGGHSSGRLTPGDGQTEIP